MEVLIRADAHCSLDRVIPNKKLGQRQGVASGAVGDIDATDLVAQMARLRDEVPQQIFDPLGPLVGDIAVNLKYVDRLAVAVAGELQMQPSIARAVEQRGEVGVRQSRPQDMPHIEPGIRAVGVGRASGSG